MRTKNKPSRLPTGVSRMSDGRLKIRATWTQDGVTREAERLLSPETTLGEAVDARARLREELSGRATAPALPPLFPTYAALWLQRKAPRVAEATLHQKALHLELHARPVFEHLRLDQIDRRALLRWRDQLSDALICRPGHPLHGRPYSRLTLANIWRITLAVLRDGWAEWELRDPSARIEPPTARRAPRRGRAPSLEELRALLAHLEGGELWLPALVLASTGLRQGELRQLTWADLDLAGRALHLRAEVCKTRRQRLVPLPEEVAERLGARYEALKAAQHPLLERGLVFGRRDGAPWGDTYLTVRLRAASLALGLERITPHDLRRAFVTHAIEAGVNAMALRAVVGHSSEAMTHLYYRPQEASQRAAVEQVWALGLSPSSPREEP